MNGNVNTTSQKAVQNNNYKNKYKNQIKIQKKLNKNMKKLQKIKLIKYNKKFKSEYNNSCYKNNKSPLNLINSLNN